MQFFIPTLLVSIYAGLSLGGTLEVIDYNHQCLIWSVDNYGCLGYSESFGLLNGNDCSGFSKLVDGTREDYSVLTVDTCGTEDGLPAAWIQVKQTGIVTFFNQNGDKSTCILDKGFKVGSRCNTFNPDFFLPSQSSRSSILLTTPTTFTNSTSSPLAMTPLAKSTSLGCVAAQ